MPTEVQKKSYLKTQIPLFMFVLKQTFDYFVKIEQKLYFRLGNLTIN